MVRRAVELGSLGTGRRNGRPQPRHAREAAGSSGPCDRGLQRVVGVHRQHRAVHRQPVPRGVGDVHGLARGRQRHRQLSLHPRSRHDPHRRLRPPLLRREDVERLPDRRVRHHGARGDEERHPDHAARRGHARRAVRHPASPGRAVPGGRRADPRRRPGSLGGAVRRPGRPRRRVPAALGPLGAPGRHRAVRHRRRVGRHGQHGDPLAARAGRGHHRLGDAGLHAAAARRPAAAGAARLRADDARRAPAGPTIATLPIPYGTGSPVNPIAVF